MEKLNIVVISRTILPTVAPRSFRATELAKALSKKGHNVTLMASLGKYDYSAFEKTTNVKVEDLGTPYFSLRNSDGKLKVPLWKKGVIFILMKLLLFPDILLVFKAKKAVLKKEKIDLLITIAFPHSLHWGVSMIDKKQRNFNTWISDCGDPFMGNSVSKPLFYFKYLEKFWGRKTDYISVPIKEAKSAYYKEVQNKIRVIPQGFDFSETQLDHYTKNEIPTFLYAGLFYPELRDPTNFLSYLSTLTTDFKFIIYTSNITLLKPYKEILKDKLEIRETIDRNLLMKEMSKMDFLLNIENKGTSSQVPSKLIDYSLAKRPIINISSEFSILEKDNFDRFMNHEYSEQFKIDNFEQYDSKNIAEEFIKLYKEKNEHREFNRD